MSCPQNLVCQTSLSNQDIDLSSSYEVGPHQVPISNCNPSSYNISKLPGTDGNHATTEAKVDNESNQSSCNLEKNNISVCDPRDSVLDQKMTCYSTTETTEDSQKLNDVEKIAGKIVYNPDGSAYVIDSNDQTDEGEIPCQTGNNICQPGANTTTSSPLKYPRIANALYITKCSKYNKSSLCHEEPSDFLPPDHPIVHSYRVIQMLEERSNPDDIMSSTPHELMPDHGIIPAAPVKPILMCFLCKLSFGSAISFQMHCFSSHQITLSETEKQVMKTKHTSAIIQMPRAEALQKPLVSFLEPVANSSIAKRPDMCSGVNKLFTAIENTYPSDQEKKQALSPNAIKGLLSAALTTHVPIAVAGSTHSTIGSCSDAPFNNFTSLPSTTSESFALHARNPFLMGDRSCSSGNGTMLPNTSIPSNANMLQGTTIGACPDHVNGRQAGVECLNCDLILNRMPGSTGWNAARNSCKTLKCPKCNWHYKYQETLEIHMKEKHPESETTCMYCITGQNHPRLARGETYTCGYKPYRCEVCNYSTTTKGNLSIHMQSDKHLNNMQELQNGTSISSVTGRSNILHPTASSMARSIGSNTGLNGLIRPKSSWRCEVCNYETSVARNLRIHMTSEKHTHNIIVLQQNVKNMHQMVVAQGALNPMGYSLPQALPNSHLPNSRGLVDQMPDSPPTDKATADMAYLQAALIQIMAGSQYQSPFATHLTDATGAQLVDLTMFNPNCQQSLKVLTESNTDFLFECCICSNFGADDTELLSNHLSQDRSKGREQEVSMMITGNFICKLCNYKTTLKANFQLHSKTDKHLQRLNHFNHIKEGGQGNEWQLKTLNVSNPVKIRCNACDYVTYSLHKLQLHTTDQKHKAFGVLLLHLKRAETQIQECQRAYFCSLCKFSASTRGMLMQHARTTPHSQMEQINLLRNHSYNDSKPIGDIFQVTATPAHSKPTLSLDTDSDMSKTVISASKIDHSKIDPMCNNSSLPTRSTLEVHTTDSLKAEEIKQLVKKSDNGCLSDDQAVKKGIEKKSNSGTPNLIPEKPVYRFRCHQCSLAFKTSEKLSVHSQYHAIRENTRCRYCGRTYRSIQALIKHVETGHEDVPKEDSANYKLGLMTHPFLSGQLSDVENPLHTTSNLQDEDETRYAINSSEIIQLKGGEGSMSPEKGTNINKRVEKNLTYPTEKYLDPNRPYKCDVCKESFTQKNILMVHYNSVSHLHKLKKTMKSLEHATRATGSQLENAINNLRRFHDEEAKPFKCNICMVAFTESSTLDIHIRSRRHQSRSGKLHELALLGQIDLNKPLLEQPEAYKALDKGSKQQLQDIPAGLNSSPGYNSQSPPNVPAVCLQISMDNPEITSINMENEDLGLDLQTRQAGQDQLFDEQIRTFMQHTSLSPFATADEMSPDFDAMRTLIKSTDCESQKLKKLLQNYGFELVTQYNEYQQRRKRGCNDVFETANPTPHGIAQAVMVKKDSDSFEPIALGTCTSQINPKRKKIFVNNSSPNKCLPHQTTFKRDKPSDRKSDSATKNGSQCPSCYKEFSSIWVLKAHSEEIHNEVVPPDFLEKYVLHLTNKMDNELEDFDDANTSGKNDILCHGEDSQNPKNNSHVKHTSKKKQETEEAESHTLQSQSLLHNESKKSDATYGHETFQKALLSAQQQSQLINPFTLPLSQLQGMNPLVAMNLQPPLIPLPLIKNNTDESNYDTRPATGESLLSLLIRMQCTPPDCSTATDENKPVVNSSVTDKQKSWDNDNQDSMLLAENTPSKAFLGKLQADQPKQKNDPVTKNSFESIDQISTSTEHYLDHPFTEQMDLVRRMDLMHQTGNPQSFGMDFTTFPYVGIPINFASCLPGPPKNEDNSNLSRFFMCNKANFPQPEQTKRARTRITDEQLKVLRSYFDINNSPTEESIATMANKTALPQKVIKHWFRNTLFKERQRNKDSPYNFNNPPSTTLNLEEYEKTEEPNANMTTRENPNEYSEHECESPLSQGKYCGSPPITTHKKAQPWGQDTKDEILSDAFLYQKSECSSGPPGSPASLTNNFEKNSHKPPLTHLLSSQCSQKVQQSYLPQDTAVFSGVTTSLPSISSSVPLGSFFNPLTNIMGGELSPRQVSPSPSQQTTPIQGKRANRTRFTDYQIKVLQEFFENNAYPKDDDLEYLSKLLNLSPRVIVVWFQNARQKARKIYENQPALDSPEDGSGRFTRTPGLNYQCKKCLLVFQRYYELIRHQKQHCFKEEDAKRSAQAQKAAAQAAAQFSSASRATPTPQSEDSDSSFGHDARVSSPLFSTSYAMGQPNHRESFEGSEDSHSDTQARKVAEIKKMTPSMFDQLARANPFEKFERSPSCGLFQNFPHSSQFGMLHHQGLLQSSSSRLDRDSEEFDNDSISSSPSSKRKLSEDGDVEEKDDGGQQKDKRLRTTILPEQLDFLYQKYQIESNPSRKMLEHIANEVGLRKRVVQVWFQNTRARERKGQFRAHQQVINKKCPYCPALFKVRSALESHLHTRHSDLYARGEVDIDGLPEAVGLEPGGFDPRGQLCTTWKTPHRATDNLGESMRQYYEDTMKRYMNDLQTSNVMSDNDSVDSKYLKALDLTSGSNRSASQNGKDGQELEERPDPKDPISEPGSELLDGESCDFDSDSYGHLDHTGSPLSPKSKDIASSLANKRFRTQMSNFQIKMMKCIFAFYKTPSMNECSSLGKELALQKRVVQVWFQNARAKEKKIKMQLQNMTGEETDIALPDHCSFCKIEFHDKNDLQDHIFTTPHYQNLRRSIEGGKFEPESPGDKLYSIMKKTKQGLDEFSNNLPKEDIRPEQSNLELNPTELDSTCHKL